LNLRSIYKFKKFLNGFFLFIFFIFSVSDLIEIHLKVIYKIDLYAAHNPYSKTNSSHKIKVGKSKTKNLHSGSNLFNLLSDNSELNTFISKVNVFFKYKISSKLILNTTHLIPRAPPLV